MADPGHVVTLRTMEGSLIEICRSSYGLPLSKFRLERLQVLSGIFEDVVAEQQMCRWIRRLDEFDNGLSAFARAPG